jgi:hypothetical protein
MVLSDRPELRELAKKAIAAFEALTPEEKARHRREQAISWVYGEMVLSRACRGLPDLTEDEAAAQRREIGRLYDEQHGRTTK